MTEREALKLALEALENNRQTHHYCEDTWYSCPKHEDGCANDAEGDECNCGADKANAEIDATITAIKEALAQPEQLISDQINYGMSVTQGGKRIDPMSIYKEPEQEPVAWMDDYNACKCPDNEARCFSDKVFRMMQKHTDSLVKRQEPVAKVCHDLDGHIGWNPNLKQLPNEGTPLYTTPPQRKPLTDEEFRAILRSLSRQQGWDGDGWDLALKEAIEAAHGIKELA